MKAFVFKTLLEKCLQGSPYKSIQNISFPKKIYWLNGAPGAGKGTHTPLIRDFLGISTPSIIVSDLLNESQHKNKIDSGLLVDDETVIVRVFRKLLEKPYRQVALIDGFPRTHVQADFLKKLYGLLNVPGQREKPLGFLFIVLYVDEQHSIERQLKRGREASITGSKQVRLSDTQVELAQKRYTIFQKETLAALETLKENFHYLFIDVSGDLKESQQKILFALNHFREK